MDGYVPSTEGEVIVHDDFNVVLCYDDIDGANLNEEEYIAANIIPSYNEYGAIINEYYSTVDQEAIA